MFFQNSSDQIIKSRIEIRELLNHYFINDFSGLVIHDLMDSVIKSVSWGLQFFKQRV